jgi:hypothetical protein
MDGMNALGVKKNSFREGSLSRIDMGADADVSDSRQISFHSYIFPSIFYR